MNLLADAALLRTLLDKWDVPPVVAIEDMRSSNPVWKISTGSDTFVLKDIGDAPDLVRLQFTADVLAHVAAAGIRVPLPLLSCSAEPTVELAGRFYMLALYIDAGEYPREPERRAELYMATGEAIAALHAALATYPDPAVHERTWREDLATYVGIWANELLEKLPMTEAAVVTHWRETWGDTTAQALRDLPEQLIHRDCHPGNILVDGTRAVGFVDCDHFCIGPRIFDLAYYASNVIKWSTDDEAAMERWLGDLPALLTGYATRQSLTDAERAALPHAMIAYHLLMAYFFLHTSRHDWIARELAALAWLDQHLQTVTVMTDKKG